jgi:hypothetical protein
VEITVLRASRDESSRARKHGKSLSTPTTCHQANNWGRLTIERNQSAVR